jgi:hypothetical protein
MKGIPIRLVWRLYVVTFDGFEIVFSVQDAGKWLYDI